MMIEIALFHLRLPLYSTYHLSFGSISHYDTFLLILCDDKKKVLSEVTALPGYSWETPTEMWKRIVHWLDNASRSLRKLINTLHENAYLYPFSVALFNVALEKHSGFFGDLTEAEIPLVGTISTSLPEKASKEAEDLVTHEYRTIKLKIKGDIKNDISVIESVYSTIKEHALLRLDANQAYSLVDAMKLLESIPHEGIELLEQPFRKEEWLEMQELRQFSPIPLMLDEGIWKLDDIRRACAFKCADYVKLKVFKHGSLETTMRMINAATRNGLKVVLGNGVQTDIGCTDEGFLHKMAGLKSAAECNGFLKQRFWLLENKIIVRNGTSWFPSSTEIDIKTVEDFSINTHKSKLRFDIPKEEYHEKIKSCWNCSEFQK